MGGILATRKIADMVDAHYGVILPHSAQGPICTLANLQIDACTPNFYMQEYFDQFNEPWEKDLLTWTPKLVDGYLELPTSPGLGAELNLEEVKKHPYTRNRTHVSFRTGLAFPAVEVVPGPALILVEDDPVQGTASRPPTAGLPMLMKLGWLDFAIIITYFVVVLGVGYWLKGKMKTSSDFLLSKRSFSHWITGIAFMSANLGALEVMGHTANGAKYGMRTNNWYWIGAIPAMVFLGLFMVRYYYANGVRSVPEYLRMRYDHRAHILNAFSFAIVTVLMSGIDMFAFAVVFRSMLGWPFTASVLLASGVVLVFVFWGGLSSSIYNEFLQFFLIVIGFLPSDLPRAARGGRLERTGGQAAGAVSAHLERDGRPRRSAGSALVGDGGGHRAVCCSGVLVHRLPAGAARPGRQGFGFVEKDAAGGRDSQDAVPGHRDGAGDARPGCCTRRSSNTIITWLCRPSWAATITAGCWGWV